jgi:peptidyl-prolyl cis-trans isomerase D
MLQNMRDGAGKWIVWVIIVILIIALGLWGISYYFMDGGAQTPPVAKVNGTAISQDELSNAYNRLRQTQPKLFTEPNASSTIKKQILENLVSEEVLYQSASDMGFAIGTAQLDDYLAQVPAFQENGKFSQARFNMILNRLMYTPAQFMQSLQKSAVISQLQNGIAASAFAMPSEVKQFAELLTQKRDIGYMLIPLKRFMDKVVVSEQQIKNYYQQNSKDYQSPEKVSINYVEITPQSIEAAIKPTAAALMSYYENNQSNYTTPARWHVAHILLNVPENADSKQLEALKAKLTSIRAEAEKGESFAALAKKYSNDIVTANNGGEMPWFTAGNLGPVFENTVAALKVGEISAPVQTQYGYELIKLLAVDKQNVKPYSAVESEVKAAYLSQQMHKIMADKQDTLSNITFENPNTLAPAAKQLNLEVKTSDLFTRKGESSGLLANPNIIATAFSDDVLQQSNNSDVLTLKDGTLVVLRVNKHVPATEVPLTEVSTEIKTTLQKQQAEKDAAAFAQSLIPQMKTSRAATDVALQHQLEWVTKPDVTRISKGIDPQILQQAFTMSGPQDQQALSLQGLALSNGDYALVGVSKVIIANDETLSKDRLTRFEQQAENTMAASSYAAIVKMAKDRAKVKYYQQNAG